ncbi:MAG: glucose-1-phosphate thymidylyltransferase [Bacillota bacterium]
MKALILAGGTGTRLKPLTCTMAKQLVPVANRPVLHYVMDKIAETGITDVGVIISPETGGQIKTSIGEGEKWKVSITYILQKSPAGLAHAVKTAQPFLKDSPFLMFLGDSLIRDRVNQLIQRFFEENAQAAVLVKEVEDPRSFGVAVIDEHSRVLGLVEKPQNPPGNLALVGIYVLSPEIHRAIEKIKPSRRGELEITDAIQELLKTGHRVLSRKLPGWWVDTGNMERILEANRAILGDFTISSNMGETDTGSIISGRVQIGPGTRITSSTVRGPAIIGENCLIEESFIGPFTAIGNNTVIQKSAVQHSVIMENCMINCPSRLEDSVVGPRTKITQKHSYPGSLRLSLGEQSEVVF